MRVLILAFLALIGFSDSASAQSCAFVKNPSTPLTFTSPLFYFPGQPLGIAGGCFVSLPQPEIQGCDWSDNGVAGDSPLQVGLFIDNSGSTQNFACYIAADDGQLGPCLSAVLSGSVCTVVGSVSAITTQTFPEFNATVVSNGIVLMLIP